MYKQHSTRRRPFYPQIDLHLRKKLLKFYIWSIGLYGAEIWTLQNIYQKYVESFHMWCWRKLAKINWAVRVRNETLYGDKEERNIVNTIKRRKANWISPVLRTNCLLKHVIEREEGKKLIRDWKTRKKT